VTQSRGKSTSFDSRVGRSHASDLTRLDSSRLGEINLWGWSRESGHYTRVMNVLATDSPSSIGALTVNEKTDGWSRSEDQSRNAEQEYAVGWTGLLDEFVFSLNSEHHDTWHCSVYVRSAASIDGRVGGRRNSGRRSLSSACWLPAWPKIEVQTPMSHGDCAEKNY
jgi:hypothetical protein